ncbi:Hypothetical protein, putative [Bodo saltans]|uniref:Uncharacterized protein n=1 Tax=Bodo saltans TaxID=75058 RepID=A0A0S4KLF0_BODSA|nr:Hypothetical protein, putative [Bodo saltans]|eukprot:CUI14413.1 Hypothetical protein, putative [Bodo saltans]
MLEWTMAFFFSESVNKHACENTLPTFPLYDRFVRLYRIEPLPCKQVECAPQQSNKCENSLETKSEIVLVLLL